MNEIDENYEAYMADTGRDNLAKSRELKPETDAISYTQGILDGIEKQKRSEANPKPDESRLLTDDEVKTELEKYAVEEVYFDPETTKCIVKMTGNIIAIIRKAQLTKDMEWEAKTASIKEKNDK